ncbi:MAG: hypothetical protein WDW38_006420 [Sanguina aurantia]
MHAGTGTGARAACDIWPASNFMQIAALRDIAQALETEHVEGDRLGRNRVLGAFRRDALAKHQRTNAIGIAKRDQAIAEHQRHAGLATTGAHVNAGDGLEDMVRCQRHAVLDLQLVRQHVEQYFGVGIGIDVAAIVLEHLAAQRFGVHQVAVVGGTNAMP